MGDQDTNVQVTYPSAQATWMKGELNITIRGEDAKVVVNQLAEAVSHARVQQAFYGDKSTQITPTQVSGEKCEKCGSDMTLKTKSKKDGSGDYQILECNNTDCNTNFFNGKYFRTSRYPKKR